MIVYLDNLSSDSLEHAKRFGATYDGKGRWYAVEPVHYELMNYIEKPAFRMKQDDAPPCPYCGTAMKLRESKAGENFWGCSGYPKCTGTLPYGHDIQQTVFSKEKPEQTSSHDERMAFLKYALTVLGSEQQLHKWLSVPKVGLGNMCPQQCLHDAAALKKMYEILNNLYS